MDEIQRYDILVVKNPFSTPFTAEWGKQPYTVPANGELAVPEFLAHHIADKMIDVMIQQNEGVKSLFSKPLREKYKKDLITKIGDKQSEDTRTPEEKLKDGVDELQTQYPTPAQPAQPVQPAVDENGEEFVDLNEETPDVNPDTIDTEAVRKESLAQTNPRAARAEQLEGLDYAAIQGVARDYEISVNQKREVLVEEILNAEFPQTQE